jgi:Zn-dependent membrane protease YugP
MIFDPLYFIIIGPGILLGIYAQWKVTSAYHRASRIGTHSGITGAQAAATVLDTAGLHSVGIEDIPGQLTDHYDPHAKVLRLSPDVYEGNSIASVGIAAHEAGHAIQDARRYTPLILRNAAVPLANFGSGAGWIILILGFALQMTGLIWIGIAVFSMTVLFQLVNLPVEFDASRRAKIELVNSGIITAEELPEVRRVLSAAALTYVAATLSSVLTLVYFLMRAAASSRRSG